MRQPAPGRTRPDSYASTTACLSLPIAGLVYITWLSVWAAVIAATGPARRASRVQVVQALAQQ